MPIEPSGKVPVRVAYHGGVTSQRNILITGGAGLIGRLLRQRLADRYALSSFDRRAVDGIPSFVGDLSDEEGLLRACTGQDTVIHLAADPSEVAPWQSVLSNNVVGTYNLFEAARRAGVRRIVFASSNHASGGFYRVEPWRSIVEGRYDGLTPGGYPLVDEGTRIRPDGLYGVSKAFGEALGSLYADDHGLSSIHLRIGWVRGDDDPSSSPFARAIWLSQRDAVQIVERAIETPMSYGIYFATSDNEWKIFSIDRARQELGYAPLDRAPDCRVRHG